MIRLGCFENQRRDQTDTRGGTRAKAHLRFRWTRVCADVDGYFSYYLDITYLCDRSRASVDIKQMYSFRAIGVCAEV